MNERGETFLDDQRIDREVALSRVTSATTVELGAERGVSYEMPAKFMAELQARGAREVALMTL